MKCSINENILKLFFGKNKNEKRGYLKVVGTEVSEVPGWFAQITA
jgi:hypothetical protein